MQLNLNEDLEWALDMDIFRRFMCRFGKPNIDLFALGSIINLKNTCHLDKILMQWQWMPFQYLGLNNMSIFCTFQRPQYDFT